MEDLVNQLRTAYSGKRVLVTGHNGFKGTWITALLNYLGAEVHGISLEIASDSPFKDFHGVGVRKEYFQDIRDFPKLSGIIKSIDAEIVFHLAAQALVLESYAHPRETFEVNVMGTANLLESLLETSCKGVVIATTDKVYKNDNMGAQFKETDELWGHDPYSLSKTGTELVVSAWRNLVNKCTYRIVTARAGNVFGPGDRAANRLLPDLVRGWINHESIVIRNPNSIRPWQFVLDPLIGYLKAGQYMLDSKDLSPAYNFGPTEESFIPVEQVAALFASKTQIAVTVSKTESAMESHVLKLNSESAAIDLNWFSYTKLDVGLGLLIKYEELGLDTSNINALLEEYFSIILE